MAGTLKRSPAANSVLTVPPEFNFMDIKDLGRYLFVRSCYVSLQRIIFSDMIPKRMMRISIMGIPGIGKTCF